MNIIRFSQRKPEKGQSLLKQVLEISNSSD